jgi:glucose/arabinose dehydrogenase
MTTRYIVTASKCPPLSIAFALASAIALTTTTTAQQTAPPTAPAASKNGESRVLAFEGMSGGDLSERGGPRVKVVQLADGLVSPWSMAFVPGTTDLLIAERPGRIRIMRNGVLDPTPLYTMPAEPLDRSDGRNNSDRLHFLAFHPQFAQNQLLYLSYHKWGARGHTLAVARGRFDGRTLTDLRDILVTEAWVENGKGTPASAVSCGRLLFGPDGLLYVTVGDRDYVSSTDDNSVRIKAQDLSSHAGKVLRIRDDGTAPSDNPFVNRPGAKPEIYTYGHRNIMGLAFANGHLWGAEIGPMNGDELNLLLPGHNYGWPLVSLGRIYTYNLVSDQPWWRQGMDMPEMFWSPSVSPSSLIFYTGDRFPTWKGSLFFGALNGRALWRVLLDEHGLMHKGEPYHNNEWLSVGARIRDVVQAPNGDLYLSTDARGYADSSTSGTILRVESVQ